MAYDELLARRIGEAIAESPEHAAQVTERRMFGGLAFLVAGHMAVAAGSSGAMMVRCAPQDADRHHAAGAEPMVMRGRELAGWLEVGPDHTTTDADLAHWVQIGLNYVDTLPPKRA